MTWLGRFSLTGMWRKPSQSAAGWSWAAFYPRSLSMSSSPACCPTLSVTWRKCLHSLSFEQLPLRPASSRYQNKEPAQSPPRSPLCRRLCTSGPHRIRPAADAGPLLKRLQALRPDSQSRQDEGAPPTWTKHLSPGTQHSHWWHTTCQRWTFQVSWKHHFLRWLPGQGNRHKNQQGKPGAGQTPQPSAQPTQHPAINKTESLQCCGSPLPPLRLWNVDTVL